MASLSPPQQRLCGERKKKLIFPYFLYAVRKKIKAIMNDKSCFYVPYIFLLLFLKLKKTANKGARLHEETKKPFPYFFRCSVYLHPLYFFLVHHFIITDLGLLL